MYLQAQAYSAKQPSIRDRSVSTEVQLDLDESIKRRFGTVADDARVRRTTAALEANGIPVLRAADTVEAKQIVLGLISDGSQVNYGASQSLEDSGIIDERSPRYDAVRPRIRSLDRNTSRKVCAGSNDYSFPLEDARAHAAYGIHSAVNRVPVITREIIPDRITVVLVDEVLGFLAQRRSKHAMPNA